MIARVRRGPKRAFTLVEILIVVVILGILAAIVIPQFTNASQEATASSLRSMLQTIRSQIELYRVKNNGTLPDMTDWTWAVDGKFLQAAPVNPYTGSSTIDAAEAQDVGWVWDDVNGQIYASGFDELTGEFTQWQ